MNGENLYDRIYDAMQDGKIGTVTVPWSEVPASEKLVWERIATGQPEFTCCGFDMAYEEFADIRRYHCTYRHGHPVIYVDQRDGTWERREH